ncbi:hypothetical protein [Streptomyces sp. NPDC089919]|uniref:hypothetical protein n=1 Tax=Streptomyces sp. NPDC089919 TaxID=3155188 RepID=UPI0034156F44
MHGEVAGDQVRFRRPCPACGAAAVADGGQALIGGRLEWSIETDCPACGPVLACGRAGMPAELRRRLLAEGAHGPVRLELDGAVRPAVVMKVLRAELALDLAGARAALAELRAGRYTGTLAEVAYLVAAFGAVGAGARAVRARDCGSRHGVGERGAVAEGLSGGSGADRP